MDLLSYKLGKASSGGGGSGGLDWSAIGYSSTPKSIENAYNLALQIKENWTSSSRYYDYKSDLDFLVGPLVDTSANTSFNYFADGCVKLIQVPLLNTSNVTSFSHAFSSCTSLVYIPVLNTSKVTNFSNAFDMSYKFNDETLDNILQMCINATSYTGTKTLFALGIKKSSYPASRIEALPHYQAFIDAGWTTGF